MTCHCHHLAALNDKLDRETKKVFFVEKTCPLMTDSARYLSTKF